MPEQHDPGCHLDPVHWLRHAIAATNLRLDTHHQDAASADDLSSASLLNGLEYFAEQPDWRDMTLLDVTRFASLMGEKFRRVVHLRAAGTECRDTPASGNRAVRLVDPLKLRGPQERWREAW